MKCPKCGYIQAGGEECANCGIIFIKYEAYLQKKQKNAPPVEPRKRSALSLVILGGVLGGALAVGGQYVLTKPSPAPENRETAYSAPAQSFTERDASISQDDGVFEGEPSDSAGTAEDGLAGQLAEGFAPVGPIEAARNATVSLVAPWGSGSGFFIDAFGTIITNRHVVQVDQKQLSTLESQAQELAEQLKNERKNLDLNRKQVKNIHDQEIKQQMVKNLSLREKRYTSYNGKLEQLERQIATIKQSDFTQDGKVVLIDGSEYSVSSLQISPNNDLALLSIDAYNSPAIPLPEKRSYVQQGATVYTIGSPVGLHHTVTSGVISGYREINGKKLVQIDAPINPGNSGGPLINDQGQVLGVNTMIINNTEGIGFAIPFDTVFQDFPGAVQSE
ncbi:MAG: hypothetical protein CSB34_04940 [Desulfobulbus propionicus]|nr:MAG: hypothetical protein CSB34_04940 [Desulfobulbus propionicus]